MDCKNIEEILVDYIENFLDLDQRKLVDSHLSTCYECSGKIKEFSSIKNALKSEVLPEVSPKVIENLKIEAQQRSENKSAFWKKWFYSPVLIPVLSTAIAIMVWIDYTYNQNRSLDNTGFYSRQVMAKKDTLGRSLKSSDTPDHELDNNVNELLIGNKMTDTALPEYEAGELNAPDRTSEKEEIPEESGKIEQEELVSNENRSVVGSILNEEGKDDYKILADHSGPNKEEVFDSQQSTTRVSDSSNREGTLEINKNAVKDRRDSYDSTDSNYKGNAYRIPDTTKPASKSIITSKQGFKISDDSRLKKPEPPQVVIDKTYIDELHTALQQQKAGNCDDAITTNENLLQNRPAPSDSIKAQSYLSLAECYEKQNKYSKAIENYSLLRKVSPSQSIFAGEKIDELKMKIKNTGDSEPAD